MIRYYLAICVGRCLSALLDLFCKKETHIPGKIALFLCPNFLSYVKKPKTMIGVVGRDGKKTVCNLVLDLFFKWDISVIHNQNSSNSGIVSSFLKAKGNEEYAILEMDERDFMHICSYFTFDYLVVTNLSCDSIHKEESHKSVRDMIDPFLSPSTTLLLNADDLISSQIGENNKRVYFGMDPMENIVQKKTNSSYNLTNCPKCHHALVYDFVFNSSMGKAHCEHCSFTSFTPNYRITEIDYYKKKLVVRNFNKTNVYPIIFEDILNIYHELAVITLLSELKFNKAHLSEALKNAPMTDSI